MSDQPNTDRLLPALREGCPLALAQVQSELSGMAVTSIRRFIRCEEDIEELVSETFLRVWRSIGNFRGDSTLATYVYRIAGNLAMNRYHYWRRRKRDLTLSLDMPMGESEEPFHALIADSRDDLREQIQTDEHKLEIGAAFLTLTARQQEILVLLVGDSMSYEEIAAKLGLNLGTVKSRIARARICLKEALAQNRNAA